MPRPRRPDQNEATANAIKTTARQLMTEHGTAGLSLRAIARKMDLSAPALYHYFSSLHDLITALITDAFNGQAEAVRTARENAAARNASYGGQLLAAMLAYREWALAHEIDFQLIYGNPIPGYVAPADVTTPAARSVGEVFLETIIAALQSGSLVIPSTHRHIPPTVADHYRQYLGGIDDEVVIQAMYIMTSAWGMIHGMVTLEVYHHYPPVIGDTAVFYRAQMISYLSMLGLSTE